MAYRREDEEERKRVQEAGQKMIEERKAQAGRHMPGEDPTKRMNLTVNPARPNETRTRTVDLNNLTLGNAYHFAAGLATDDERDNFLNAYRSHIGKKSSANYQTDVPTLAEMRKGVDSKRTMGVYADTVAKNKKAKEERRTAMLSVSGLYDVNGNAINANTADFATVVQGIRSIADTDKRKNAVAGLKKLTETEGSRFYGQTLDETLAKTYLGNPDFTQDDYDDFTAHFKDSFYPQSGHEDENRAQYEYFLADITEGGYSPDVQRQLIDRLNIEYRNQTGKAYEAAKPEEADAELEEPAEQEGEEKAQGLLDKLVQTGSDIGAWWNELTDGDRQLVVENKDKADSAVKEFLDGLFFDGAKYLEEHPEQSKLPDGVVETGRLASATVSDVVPPMPTKQWLDIKDDGDVLSAIFEGQLDMVREADAANVMALTQSKTGQQILGTVMDAMAVAEVKANNRGGENVVRENYGRLGTKASTALEMLLSEDYPEKLRNDGVLILLDLADRAEKMQEAGVLGGEEGLPLLERLLTTDETARAQFDLIYAAKEELEADRTRMREEQQMASQQALDDARAAVLSGEYSEEQLRLVQENAPEMTNAELYADRTRTYMSGYAGDLDYGYFAEGGEYENSAVRRSLNSNGVLDDFDYRRALSQSMQWIIDDDTETAMSLGMSLEEYYNRIGGMTMDDVCQRAASRISQQGASITPEDEEILTYGEGVGWAKTTGIGINRGVKQLYGSYMDSIYMGMTEMDVVRQAGRMRVLYQDEFGLWGRTQYRHDMQALIDSGTLNESYAKALQQALDEASDVYDVGVDPEKYEWFRLQGSDVRKNIKGMDAYMRTHGTEGENKAYQRVSGMTSNALMAGIAVVGSAMFGRKAGFALGYSIPSWSGNFTKYLDQDFKRNSAKTLASISTGMEYIANVGTFSNILERATGVTSAMVGEAFDLLKRDPAGMMKAIANTKAYAFAQAGLTFAKTAAQNVLDEAVSDTLKENALQSLVDRAYAPLFRRADTGEDVSFADMLGAMLDVRKIDFKGVVADVKANFVESAIQTSLFALAGAAKAAGSEYKAVTLAQDILSGKSMDIDGFLDAAGELVNDPTFREIINQVAEQQMRDEATVEALAADDRSDGLLDKADAANETADSHKAGAEACEAAMSEADAIMSETQEKIDNGTADDADVEMNADASMAYAKNKTGYDEHRREEAQKRAEAVKAEEEKLKKARAQAAKEVERRKQAAREAMIRRRAEAIKNLDARMEELNRRNEADFAAYEAGEIDDAEFERRTTETGSRIVELDDQRENVLNAPLDADYDAEYDSAEEAAYSAQRQQEMLRQEAEELRDVHDRLRNTPVYVDESQKANILSATGMKSIGQVNIKYGVRLVTDKSKADVSLDSSFWTELAEQAPGRIDATESHPEDALVRMMERKKELNIARAMQQRKIGASTRADSEIQVQPYHTPEQVRQIREYHNAVDERLLSAAKAHKNQSESAPKRTPVSEVGSREAEEIKRLTGVDVEGYVHTADANFFNHVEKRHGERGEHDQSMKNLEDVARAGWVIENYDSVELLTDENGDVERASGYLDRYGEHEPLIRFKKQLDGSVYVVEAVGESSWKKLWLVSAYIEKKGPAQSAKPDGYSKRLMPSQTLGTTSETKIPSPVTSTIAQPDGVVKSQQAGEVQKLVTLDGQTVNPTPTLGEARRNPIQIFKRLSKDLNIGQAIGTRKLNGLEGRAAGYYDPRARYVATGTNFASNVEADAHEIGHAIAGRLNMTGTPQMIANLPANFAANYAAADLPGEAFAEFFWRYLVSDQEAESFAGRAYVATMERNLRREGVLRQVRRAQRDIRLFLQAEASEQFRLMRRDKSDTRGDDTLTELFANKEREFISRMVDSTRAAEDVNDVIRDEEGAARIDESMNLRHSALMQNTSAKRAWQVLNGNLTSVDGTVVGTSLKRRLADAGLRAEDFDTFIDYMLAKHSLDRDAQGTLVVDRGSITQDRTRDFINDVEANNRNVVNAARAFQEFRHDFMMEYMVNTGFMTQNMLNLFEQMYPNYVPTYRVKDRGRRGVGGGTYRIMRATGSTEEIINPIDSFVDMVNSIVTMNLRNETLKTWDRVYNQYEGLGVFGRLVTEDTRTDAMDMRGVQAQVEQILMNAGADVDVVQSVLDVIGDTQYRRRNTGTVDLPNVVSVQLPNGDTRFYEIFDQELFDMIEGTQDHGRGVLDFIAPLTRFMTAMTTGSNPVFGVRNFMRDYQNSVNYGSWASNYVTGAGRWLNAAWDVFRDGWIGEHTGLGERNDTYEQYKALGGGGWTRVETGTRKGAEEYRGELIEGYNTSNAGRTAKWLGKKVWNAVTLNRLNEIIEQASRYVEYKHGRHDLTTPEGRRAAYLAAQDVTTDFSRRGSSRMTNDLKAFFPFFNASLQGVYRTGRQLTDSEADRRAVRFTKTVINTGLASALAAGLMLRYLDDEDKEEFFYLSDDLKAKHMYLPNFAPDILGEAPLIRIPLNQDPLAYAVHAAVTNAMWNGNGDEWAIELSAAAQNILDNLNPVSSTVFDPIVAIKTNKNWYGSNIVPRSMEGQYVTNQYSAETPEMFIAASRALAGVNAGISPMMLQYIAEQYTGFVGQMVIPFFSKNEFTGEILGIDAVIDDVRKTLTSDPLKSNDVVSVVYDSSDLLTTVTKAAKNNKPLDMLRYGLTSTQAQQAYREAYDMTHAGGIIYEAKKAITEGYGKIDEIEADESLTDDAKYEMQSAVRREMIDTALDANEAMAEFREKYIDGESFYTRFLKGTVIE